MSANLIYNTKGNAMKRLVLSLCLLAGFALVLGIAFANVEGGLPGEVVAGADIRPVIAGNSKGVAQNTATLCSSTNFQCASGSDVGKLCGFCTGGANMACAPIESELDCFIHRNQFCCTVTEQCYSWWWLVATRYYCTRPDAVAGPAPSQFWNRTMATN